MKVSKNRRGKRRGFTLVEVLVVMAILVLLAALVVPRILGAKKKADLGAAKTQIGMLKASLERYALDMNDFPLTEQGLSALIEEPDELNESTNTKWGGPYLDSDALPKDPWGNDFQYEYPPTRGKGDYPDIWSYGPDGEDDTKDDIVSWKREDEDEFDPDDDTGPDEDDLDKDL
jgi:general secretion pathway protein G